MSAREKVKKTGSTEAKEAKLAGLYEEYYDRIACFAFVRIGDRGEAEDIAGQAFLKALESLPSFEERGVPMEAWLFKIARNLVIDHWRKTAKQRQVPMDEALLKSDADPATMAERSAAFAEVDRAMKHLTLEQREVLSLRFFAGLTSREVGLILNKNDGAVREMQRAAIEKLRELLS